VDRDARESLFESLYSAHSADVLRYALRRGVDYPDAEEVVVETFLVCWRRLGEVPDSALPWLLGVARRVLSNQWRAKGRRLALHGKLATAGHRPSLGAPDGGADPSELKTALASLRDSEREVLALVVWQGLTHEAAATVLGCTRNAVTKRYLKACRTLKAQLSSGRT
jgi:RNA polymerase sigma-70 factor (ECF subfamily)